MVGPGFVAIDGDEGSLAEALGINDLGIDVGEDLEDRADAKIVAVA